MTSFKKMLLGAIFITFGLILPAAFHFTGLPGSVFLPMHLPVLIASMFLGSRIGLAVGVLTPLLSSIATGMPTLIPTAIRMAIELGVYGLAGGYFYRHKKFSIAISLLATILLGRLAALITIYLMMMFLDIKMDPFVYTGVAALYTIPGVIVQFIFIPPIVKKLETIIPHT